MSILRPGGVIVVFDKLVPPGGYPATVQARLTRSSKLEQDAEPGAEVRKKLSLSDIQRPLYPGVPDEYTVKDEKRRSRCCKRRNFFHRNLSLGLTEADIRAQAKRFVWLTC